MLVLGCQYFNFYHCWSLRGVLAVLSSECGPGFCLHNLRSAGALCSDSVPYTVVNNTLFCDVARGGILAALAAGGSTV